MKNVLIICLMLSTCSVFAQKTKKIEVVNRLSYQEYVNAIYNYDKNNKLEEPIFHFFCQNSKYDHISDLITLFRGSAKEFYNYLTALEGYYADNVKEIQDGASISGEVNGQQISFGKISIVIYINVYTRNGYHSFTIKWINKIKSQFVSWCKKNNVAYE